MCKPVRISRATNTTLSLGNESSATRFAPASTAIKKKRCVKQTGKHNASSHDLVTGKPIAKLVPSYQETVKDTPVKVTHALSSTVSLGNESSASRFAVPKTKKLVRCVKKSGKENISSHNLVSGTDTVKSTPAAAKKDTALRCPMPVTRCTDTTLSLGSEASGNRFVKVVLAKATQRCVRTSGKQNISSHNLVSGTDIAKPVLRPLVEDKTLRCKVPITKSTDTTLSLGTDSATNHFVPSLQPQKVQRTVRQSGKANASSHNLVNGHSIDTVKPSGSRRAELVAQSLDAGRIIKSTDSSISLGSDNANRFAPALMAIKKKRCVKQTGKHNVSSHKNPVEHSSDRSATAAPKPSIKLLKPRNASKVAFAGTSTPTTKPSVQRVNAKNLTSTVASDFSGGSAEPVKAKELTSFQSSVSFYGGKSTKPIPKKRTNHRSSVSFGCGNNAGRFEPPAAACTAATTAQVAGTSTKSRTHPLERPVNRIRDRTSRSQIAFSGGTQAVRARESATTRSQIMFG